MGQARGWLNYPSDLCVDSFGRILVADTFNHRIQVFELVTSKGAEAPPASAGSSVEAEAGQVADALPEGEIQVEEVTEAAPAVATADQAPAVLPEVPRDAFVLQVAFAREPEAARALLERLAAKDYQVFIYEVDTGAKGVWYKVLIGPFADRAAAEAVAARLKTEEKLTAIVTKR
jgi:cell division septation protein DedD